ncbi:MAG: hypothetical protein ACOYXS_04360 [Chloroflexota bacterium]
MNPESSPAEELPALYRLILDGVAALERRGARVEADRIRRAAIQAYSTAWDETQLRVLEQLAGRCRLAVDALDEPADGRPRPDPRPG